ncbi:hypothetical protein Bca4012_018937 [Brassica carinata]
MKSYEITQETQLMGSLLRTRFTTIWADLMELVLDNRPDMITTFLTRYVFQITIHSIWRERNDRRHGSTLITIPAFVKCSTGKSETNVSPSDILGIPLMLQA